MTTARINNTEASAWKACIKCKRQLPIDSFSVNRASKDGRVSSCKKCKSEYFRNYYQSNKKDICAKTSKYAKNNPAVQRKAKKKWKQKNKDKHLQSRRAWHEKKYKEDLLYRLNFIVRGGLRRTLEAAKRNGKTLKREGLGYSPEMLKARIEMNFKPGMTWDNYGEWHVDHRIPVARLIRKGVTNPAIINCLANLAPLWAEDNLRKGCR